MPRVLFIFVVLWVFPAGVRSAEFVQGWMTSPAVLGDPSAGRHKWDREIVYLSSLDHPEGLATGMRMLAQERGWFYLKPPNGIAPGRYTLFTINLGNIDGGTVGFHYRPEPLVIAPGVAAVERVEFQPNAHYIAMYNRHYEEWAGSPWLWHDDFYQTFVANSDTVTRLATKLAGKDAGPGTHHLALNLNFALYDAGSEGPPSSWTRISPIRARHLPGTMDPIIHVLDVNYLSREVSLAPGRRYAFRLWVGEGSECTRFAVVARPKKDGGYPDGRAFRGDEPEDWDLYGFASGGAPDTVNNFGPTNQEVPMNTQDLLGSGPRHGQTFMATGGGLAAVELLYTVGCNPNPSMPIRVSLHKGFGGEQIGPAKTGLTVTDVCQGRLAVFWKKGEAALERGETYYLEVDSSAAGGINLWSMNGDMPNGEAYVGGRPIGPKDLALSLIEYR